MNRINDYNPDVRQLALGQRALTRRVDNYRLTSSERRAAVDALRHGDSVGDAICWIRDSLRSTSSALSDILVQRVR